MKSNRKVNKKEIAEFISNQYPKLTKEESESIITSVFRKIEIELKDGNDVQIVGFGKFFNKTLKERISTNPQNGEKFIKEQRNVIKFRIGKNLKAKKDD